MENVNGNEGQNIGEELDQDIKESSTIRLWNPMGFLVLSILFSFLPAAILYSLNYRRVGNYKKHSLSLAISFVGFVVLVSLAFLIGQGVVKSIFYGLNIGVAVFMNNDQSKMFKDHIANGGRKASYVVPVGISIVFTAVILALAIYSINIPDQKLMIKGSELYYTDNVQKADAEKLGSYLSQQGFFSDNRKISVKVDKDATRYKFSLIIDESRLADKELEQFAKDMGKELSVNVFNNNKVDIIFCNDAFKSLKTISN